MRATWLVLLLAACSAGDDTISGTRGQCATGGALADCTPEDQTPEGACWRLVDCGAIPLDSNNFDWGACVDDIERGESDSQRLILSCIAASSCEELTSLECLRLGSR